MGRERILKSGQKCTFSSLTKTAEIGQAGKDCFEVIYDAQTKLQGYGIE